MRITRTIIPIVLSFSLFLFVFSGITLKSDTKNEREESNRLSMPKEEAFASTLFTALSPHTPETALLPNYAQASTGEQSSGELEAIETPLRETEIKSAEEVLQTRSLPETIVIPAIGLSSPIEPLGIDEQGRMDVPDGQTNNVGWYEPGTMPGEKGSAVMDAHVYAAFKRLKELKIGDDIEVITKEGASIYFKVEETVVYALEDMPLERIFHANDKSRVTLITCEGTWVRYIDTYSHRRVVYAVLTERVQ